MRWIKICAALLLLSAITSQANAGWFDCCKHEPACCAPAPTCCHVQPSCCAPTPTACHVAPTCHAPAPTYGPVESSYVPNHGCYESCGPVYGDCYDYCPPKKRCCLCRLWDCEKRKNRWIMNKMGW